MKRDIERTAVITGAGSGIGRATAVALGRRGWRVGALDIDDAGTARTVELVNGSGGTGEAFHCDVTNLREVEAAAEHFYARWGKVGLLVNNAGVGGVGCVGETSVADWEKVVSVNLWGVLHGCHAFIPRMKSQGGGHIVNTSSTAGLMPIMLFAPYATTKAAVVGLSETLKVELAPYSIGVTVLCPSFVKTGIVENSLRQMVFDPDGAADQQIAEADAGRERPPLSPGDVAEMLSQKGGAPGSYEEEKWCISVIQAGLENTKLTPEDVAEMLIRGIEKDRLYVLTSRFSRTLWVLIHLFPNTYYRLWAWLSRTGRARGLIMESALKGRA